ncbi:hypothetical protein, containing PhoU domain protein, partial [mine drainage metagenome]
VEIQIFVDPTRHPLPHLRQQMVRLLRAELSLSRRALTEVDPHRIEQLQAIEDEIDQIYLLTVRQLLLASDDFRVAQEIGVPSHHYQIGDRLVAKALEMIGDRLFDTGRELLSAPNEVRRMPRACQEEIETLLDRFDRLLARTMEAFSQLSLLMTNATLNELLKELDRQPTFGRLQTRSMARATALLVQRVASNLLT